MAEKFSLGGQEAWYYDLGDWAGYFHTYDNLEVGEAKNKRKVHIFLPREYEHSQISYPVVYFNDGDTTFFPGGAFNKTWNLSKILNRLYLTNAIRKLIVVAVCPVNREYEYTHAPVIGHDWGGLEAYSQYLAYDLKSFIDNHYRTISQAESNLIVGSSHGGLAAFYTSALYPKHFGCVAALSPSFWVGLDSTVDNVISNWFGGIDLADSTLLFATQNNLENPDLKPKIYLDWGLIRDGGFHNQIIEALATKRGREMKNILINNYSYQEGKNLFIVEDAIGKHEEISWSGRTTNILKIFFGI